MCDVKKPYPMWVWLFIVFLITFMFLGRAPTIALSCHCLRSAHFLMLSYYLLTSPMRGASTPPALP